MYLSKNLKTEYEPISKSEERARSNCYGEDQRDDDKSPQSGRFGIFGGGVDNSNAGYVPNVMHGSLFVLSKIKLMVK